MNSLRAVEEWCASVCDGDWEHSYGIRIETLDNPGWAVDIDLLKTPLERRHLESTVIDRSENDWIHCRIQDGVFIGRGGPRNLDEILRRFAEWAGVRTT